MSGSMVAELTAAANVPSDVDVVIVAAKLGAQFLGSLATALETYKSTGRLPPMEASELSRFNDLIKNQGQEPTKRRKKGEKKLNKDGSEKAPRKPTAYNHWMQEKLKELKEESAEGSSEKHVDRFKAAAEFWRGMPQAEKDAIAQKFKAAGGAVHEGEEATGAMRVQEDQARLLAMQGGGADGAAAAVPGAVAHEEEEESSDEDDGPAAGLTIPPAESSESESDDDEDIEVAPPPVPPPVAAAPKPKAADPKKKKRKPDAPAALLSDPVAAAVPAADGEKKKKKKKKVLAVAQL